MQILTTGLVKYKTENIYQQITKQIKLNVANKQIG